MNGVVASYICWRTAVVTRLNVGLPGDVVERSRALRTFKRFRYQVDAVSVAKCSSCHFAVSVIIVCSESNLLLVLELALVLKIAQLVLSADVVLQTEVDVNELRKNMLRKSWLFCYGKFRCTM